MDEEAHQTFWYWINERQRIYIRKTRGEPKPWSKDPIFQTWKFCNVFREQDTQTKHLLEVIRPHGKESLALTLFNIYAFRAFNWYNSYSAIGGNKGGDKEWIDNWNERDAKAILWNLVVNQHQQLTSGAYMIKGVDGQKKWESIPETLTHIWDMKDYLAERMQDEPITTLEGLQELLLAQKFYGWGEFTTYQVVLDMTYTHFFNHPDDLNTWCAFGPGAKRGIRCIWPDAKNGEMLDYARRLYEEQDAFRTIPERLTLQDIEFSLCELSKYLRIKRGGRSKVYYAGL